MKIQHLTAIALASLLAAAWQPAAAQTATDSFQVSITIADVCTIAADDLDFGSQTSLASLVDADSDITVNCSFGTVYTVSLDQGTNGTRLMSDGSDTVDYELYTAALRAVAWGTNVGVDTVGGIGAGSDQTLTVYGRVPAQATPRPGDYHDTAIVTVSY